MMPFHLRGQEGMSGSVFEMCVAQPLHSIIPTDRKLRAASLTLGSLAYQAENKGSKSNVLSSDAGTECPSHWLLLSEP